MGLQISKQGPGKAAVTCPDIQYSFIDYLTKSIFIRNLVSKHRRRMLVAGYDLDMSYITDKVLAMSFPAERMRAMYRNPLWQVKSVLDMRHGEHYKVYNLCIEETYDPGHFHGRVELCPFDDNHVPPLEMVKKFCESVYSWLSQDPRNIVVIHCMAGKGRTGLMVCAYLVYSGMIAEEALQLYANKRTTNNEGVSIPSQRRYVGYWTSMLSFPKGIGNEPPVVSLPGSCPRELRRIRLYDMINTESIFFVVSELQEVVGQNYRPPVELAKGCCRPIREGKQTSNSPRYYVSVIDQEMNDSNSEEARVVVQMDTERPIIDQKTCLDYCFNKPVQIKGDVRVIFYQKMIGGRLFYVCFNTAFIKNSLLQFSMRDLDKIGKKGPSICGSTFCLELLFGPANSKFCDHDVDEDDDDYDYDSISDEKALL
ncbi:phosphatidylinositol 3,4,5-trisphosphate 3-phosphatase and protein-tyrosine-phosphatase PTEN1 [Mercurialis annua]|uniref:phosphatidylinositol 3,4,5-trisphosphate 3-phosphatase and protein-tyrosine-phosphatase PTEN1 n=1 Tax=Mercurialis annua TaxID=3986 RepID=UPI002160B113|nr:phosphatidylinositol 3,4,5-trisphosphate 3-phosphatase and protein-tyrosine-phosphatase PTEN1 [Mercurialis annua]